EECLHWMRLLICGTNGQAVSTNGNLNTLRITRGGANPNVSYASYISLLTNCSIVLFATPPSLSPSFPFLFPSLHLSYSPPLLLYHILSLYCYYFYLISGMMGLLLTFYCIFNITQFSFFF